MHTQAEREKRAWDAELQGLELNAAQQLSLSERIFSDEKQRHGAWRVR